VLGSFSEGRSLSCFTKANKFDHLIIEKDTPLLFEAFAETFLNELFRGRNLILFLFISIKFWTIHLPCVIILQLNSNETL